MSEQNFNLKVYTPQGLVLESAVVSVTMPGVDGEVGILPQHTQYTGVLGAGVFQYQKQSSQNPSRLIVSGGFASFQGDELVILADAIDLEENIGAIKVSLERKALEDKLASLNAFDPEWESTQQKLKRLDAVESLAH